MHNTLTYSDTVIMKTICPKGPKVNPIMWTKEQGFTTINESEDQKPPKCNGILKGTVQDFAIFGLPPHVIWG